MDVDKRRWTLYAYVTQPELSAMNWLSIPIVTQAKYSLVFYLSRARIVALTYASIVQKCR